MVQSRVVFFIVKSRVVFFMVRFNTIVYEYLIVVITLLREGSCSYTNLPSLMVSYDNIAQLG